MTELGQQYLKNNLILLADDHRKHCSEECNISLYALRELLKLAEIPMTEAELQHFL